MCFWLAWPNILAALLFEFIDKGPAEKIAEAKPGLRAIIEECNVSIVGRHAFRLVPGTFSRCRLSRGVLLDFGWLLEIATLLS